MFRERVGEAIAIVARPDVSQASPDDDAPNGKIFDLTGNQRVPYL